jgi:molecular chaperone DnaJ
MAQNFRDPYVLLGVDRSSTDTQIKRAYRKLAREFHPDVNRGNDQAEARFQEIARAYESISTEENRIKWSAEFEHDRLTDSFPDLDSQEFTKNNGHNNNYDPAAARGHQNAAKTPIQEKISKTVNITFQQAFNGLQTEINVESEDVCSVCAGSGAEPGSSPRVCDTCQGSGKHKVGRVVNVCSNCNGKGLIIENPCANCIDGKTKEKRPYILKIPAGVSNDYIMRLEVPQRGAVMPPIIEIKIEVEESAIFKRSMPDSADLVINVPISYSEAALGASIKIPTPTKVIALKVPPGTPPGKPFRISGQGMPKVGNKNNERGNLYVQTQIIVPDQLDSKQQEIITELRRYDDPNLRQVLFNPNIHDHKKEQ